MLDPMRLLFATDGSRGAEIALDFITALPLACADHVTVLTVPTYSFMGTPVLERGQADLLVDRGEASAHAVAVRALERLSVRGVPAAIDVRAGPVKEAIEAAALEYAADVIVIGSRGLGTFAGSILGSVARALARHAAVPVLVVRECRTAPRRILVAVDGSDDARAAIALLAHMPLPSDAGITLVHVVEHGADEARAEVMLAQAARTLAPHVIDEAVIERGHVDGQLLARAALAKTDLIVLGSRGQTQAAGFLHGSVADHVLSQAHCAVLVAKAALKPRVVAEPWLAMPRTAVAL
jgi:nucleotide-binding universal stress UspA family protein